MSTFLNLFHQVGANSVSDMAHRIRKYGPEIIMTDYDRTLQAAEGIEPGNYKQSIGLNTFKAKSLIHIWDILEDEAIKVIMTAASETPVINDSTAQPREITTYLLNALQNYFMFPPQNANLYAGYLTHLFVPPTAKPFDIPLTARATFLTQEEYIKARQYLKTKLPDGDSDFLIAFNLADNPLIMPVGSPVEQADDQYTFITALACLSSAVVVLGTF